jgi:calcineurin-like phosphoesterase family protein
LNRVFFTSDTHFGHSNIIRYCGRPFESKEDHDRVLIDNWNRVVTSKDTIYHLGDLGFGDAAYLHKIVSRLSGRIIFLMGNHDRPSVMKLLSDRIPFTRYVDIIKPKVQGHSQTIFLSHYPHRSWFKSNHGSWHLWGHSHGNMVPYGLSFDVGVDCWNYTPVSLEQVSDKMSTLAIALDYNPADQHLEVKDL